MMKRIPSARSARRGAPLLLALVCACRVSLPTLPRIPIPGMTGSEITEEELHQEVLGAANRFAVVVASTADAIQQRATERATRRRALLWKLRMVPLARRAALEPRATEGLLELLTIAVVQRQYLVDGAGRDLFGEQQEVARAAAVEVEADVEAVARRLLAPQHSDRLDQQVEQLARDHPIRGEFMLESVRGAFADVAATGKFDWFLRAPLAPFRALEGVESGAQAIHEFNTTARQFSGLVAALPEQIRWQLELFLYDLEDRETVVSGRQAFETLAASVERVSLAAESLPENTRREMVALLAESAEGQAELRQTLAELRETLASADGAISNARPLAESLERVTANADRAGRSFGELVRELRERRDETAGVAEARPFDVLEYERTAAQIRGAAEEVRALVADVRGERGGAPSLLDALLWRGIVLFAAWLALILVYRVIAARVAPRG